MSAQQIVEALDNLFHYSFSAYSVHYVTYHLRGKCQKYQALNRIYHKLHS